MLFHHLFQEGFNRQSPYFYYVLLGFVQKLPDKTHKIQAIGLFHTDISLKKHSGPFWSLNIQ